LKAWSNRERHPSLLIDQNKSPNLFMDWRNIWGIPKRIIINFKAPERRDQEPETNYSLLKNL
jgi:hypothetical protein